jgi:polyketide synthase PksN
MNKADIAIIGMACRLPGADSPEAFWQNLWEGVCAIREVPADRWDAASFYATDITAPGKAVSKWGGFLDGVGGFDRRFFNIPAVEAKQMDPQQRLLLEEAWHCLEDAAVPLPELQAKATGVYVGVMATDYQQLAAPRLEQTSHYSCLGNYSALLANRLSHFLRLKGESLAIDTACSASLVALHTACRALREGGQNYAFVAGCNLILHPWKTLSFSKAGMLSPAGRCKTFDQSADGYVAGEGVAVILLQPLADALRDGHRILGVVKGTAVNHNAGAAHITAPSRAAQQAAITAAAQEAGIGLDRISYLEAHGTGTSLGDPIEVEALARAFQSQDAAPQSCGIGSVKTNIGHLEAASGLAGLIKVLLMMRARAIPPTLNVETPNPLIPFETTPFRVCRERGPWEGPEPLCAGVSSFGFGGVNAHAILQSYSPPASRPPAESLESPLPFLLSARTQDSLAALRADWLRFAAGPDFAGLDTGDICRTLLTGRQMFEIRQGGFVRSQDDILALLRDWPSDTQSSPTRPGAWALAFGDKLPGLDLAHGADTYSEPGQFPAWREAMVVGHKALRAALAQGPVAESRLAKAHRLVAQWAFCLFLRECGFRPGLLAGRGTGFLASVVGAGSLSLEAALAFLLRRDHDSLNGLKRPDLPFFDPVAGTVRRPWRVDADYLRELADAAQVDEATDRHYRELALALWQHQRTFKSYLDQWNEPLQKAGSSVSALLRNEGAHHPALLRVVAIASCLRRLGDKWDLRTGADRLAAPVAELVDWVAGDALSKDDLLRWLSGEPVDLDRLAAAMEAAQHKLARPGPLLRARNTGLTEIADVADWLRRGEALSEVELPGGYPALLAVGEDAPTCRDAAVLALPRLADEDIEQTLMALWRFGVDLDWTKIVPPAAHTPLSLPKYAFQREHCWLDEPPLPARPAAPAAESVGGVNFLEPVWVRDDAPEPPAGPEPALRLIFADGAGLHEALARRLRVAGLSFVTVLPGAEFGRIDADTYTLNPTDAADYGRLLADLKAEGRLVGMVIVHYLATYAPASGIASVDELAARQESGVIACFLLAQAMARHSAGVNWRLVAATREAWAVREDDRALGYAHSGLAALLGVVAEENRRVAAVAVDLAEDASPDEAARVLMGEERDTGESCRAVAYRDGGCYRRTLRPLSSLAGGAPMLKRNGVYLLAGGLGALGFQIGSLLAQTVEATLILMGRSPLDAGKEAKLRRLNELGAEVAYFPADVGDPARMAAALDLARAEYGRLDGVIHCAGSYQPALIPLKTAEQFRACLAAKLRGVWVLDELTRHDPLDFFAVFSSISALAGFGGLADYAAANGCIDGFMDHRRRQPRPGKSLAINWGLWRTGGMGADASSIQSYLGKGYHLIDAAAGAQAFLDALNAPGSRVVALGAPGAGSSAKEENPFDNPHPGPLPEGEGTCDIAIIGMACRFPGADNPAEFWDNLAAGRETIRFFTDEELRAAGVPEERLAHPRYVRARPTIEDAECFDAEFFNYTPAEAERMDPQQRLLLECAWQALEDAGYAPNQLDVPAGVFLSVFWNMYQYLEGWFFEQLHDKSPAEQFAGAVANDKDFAATRVSYKLNLKGPSLSVQTACSSSLVAVHLAAQSLLLGECDVALAGGCSLVLPHVEGYLHQPNLVLSADGHCRAFDADADGTNFGSGLGVVVLKRLADALADGDNITAVIKGTAVNNDGAGRADFTSPSAAGQREVIARALRVSGVDPAGIGYVESHGTGTRIGDPLEFKALAEAYGGGAIGGTALGSVKTNIGHLHMAAGVAGLIKVALSLKHGKIPPTLHFQRPNPAMDLERSRFYVNTGLADWTTPGPRRAGLSSFGMGGTNAHAILEEPPAPPPPNLPAREGWYLFPVSAKTAAALERRLGDLRRWLATDGRDAPPDDLSFTLAVGRTHFKHRCVFIARDALDLAAQIARHLDGDIGSADGLAKDERLTALAAEYLQTPDFRWEPLFTGPRRRLSLPTYPFERQRHWAPDSIAPKPQRPDVNTLPPLPVGEGLGVREQKAWEDIRLPSDDAEPAAANALRFLAELLAQVTKLPINTITADRPFTEMGIDSMMVMNLNEALESHFGPLSQTLFFEYRTVGELAEYFALNHRERLPAMSPQRAGIPPVAARFEPPGAAEPERLTHQAGTASGETGDIAIIGLDGVYPMAANLDQFWQNLKAGRDCITEIPPERWDHADFFDPDRMKPGSTHSRWGGFIDDVDKFDAPFFRITPREAELLDPQERLFLQVAWHTLEDAGYTRAQLRAETVGVFVGVMWAQYELLSGDGAPLNSIHASVANRVSYALDFKGPSVALDTMCSSSLTAIHFACQAIRNGDCTMALAGGVNTTLHPNKYLQLSQGQFASTDGRCRSFGTGGDGYVPGEGVGAVLLKPLARAIADGDAIHAVIKGSSVNHGGSTNGYTVPDPRAQADLIRQAWARAGIAPDSLGYVEAHGTGTALGDPIEVEGLVKVFGAAGLDARSCPLGSVKSNLGHLEAAAGIAGLTKVLLQMRHGQIAPSLHSETLNPRIRFEHTPFHVPQTLAPWPRRRDATGAELPRRAGISAFGAGGANAHLVVEECPPSAAARPAAAPEPRLFPLSARDPERLRELAGNLAAFLDGPGPDGPPRRETLDPRDVAHTLRAGREAFDSRAALLATGLDELAQRLRLLAAGTPEPTSCFLGEASDGNGQRPSPDPASGNLEQLAALWVSGAVIDPHRLPGTGDGRRIHLPGYPFDKQRHWAGRTPSAARAVGAGRHPLLDRDQSTPTETLFSKTYTGREFYLRDHVLAGHKVLPGVVSLEMARAAIQRAVPGARSLAVHDVAWMRPFPVADRSENAVIRLIQEGEGQWRFEILGDAGGSDAATAHVRGKVRLGGDGAAAEEIDLEAIRRRCPDLLSAGDFYARYERAGLRFGPAMRAVNEVRRNAGEALATLVLPDGLRAGLPDWGFHPALTDAALQTVMALAGRQAQAEGRAYLPFGLAEASLLAPLEAACFAYASAANHTATGGDTLIFDVLIAAPDGRVLARLGGLSIRAVAAPNVPTPPGPELLMCQWRWAKAPPLPDPAPPGGDLLLFVPATEPGDALLRELRHRAGSAARLIAVRAGVDYERVSESDFVIRPDAPDDYRRLLEALTAAGVRPATIIHAWADSGLAELSDRLAVGIHSLLCLGQALLRGWRGADIRILYLYPGTDGEPRPEYAAADGFLKTLRIENPRYSARTVRVDEGELPGSIAATVLRELADGAFQQEQVRYARGERFVRLVEACPPVREDAPLPLRGGGVYLITGGAGGLGLHFARHLARRYGARLALSGRSAPGESIAASLKELAGLGSEAIYVPADVSRRDDVERLVAETRRAFGRIDGVLHSAGLARDGFLLMKERADFDAVLAPKVLGAAHLDAVLGDEALDCFVLFSSMAAVTGNLGQADYAYANGYLDHFAEWRESLRAAGLRHGLTRSINWTLWEDGGMGQDEKQRAWLARQNIVALPLDHGLAAFERALAGGAAQAMVLEGERRAIEAMIAGAAPTAEPARSPAVTEAISARPAPLAHSDVAADATAEADLRRRAEDFLKGVLAGVSKIPAASFKARQSFDAYGIDSAIGLHAIRELEGRFGDLPKTLLFEYPTIAELAGYFIDKHREALAAVVGFVPPAAIPEPPRAGPVPPPPSAALPAPASAASPAPLRRSGDIAIIGVSGRYPLADDLDEFWENLKNGKDCVTLVPGERWDYRKYYDPAADAPGKSRSKWGGFIRDADKFDALLFNIHPRQAELLDPQERIFLETCWHALEDAGYAPTTVGRRARVGVFAGVMYSEYQLFGADAGETGTLAISSFASIANRVSYTLDLRGPSLALDTMCSSSLTAIHLARESLLRGECEMALAGGVNLSLHPNKYLQLSLLRMMSSDGRCRSFAEGGDGYVPGEGVGAVLLKPLERAMLDGDPIYGVLKGSALNHGGKAGGYTVPSPRAQASLIQAAWREGGIDPRAISYVEAHGTGTSLGDPIEVAALSAAFAEYTDGRGFCALGSVKSNIGHLESAAGIAAVTKVLLQMRHGQLAPSLIHGGAVNPHIDFAASPFVLQRGLAEWRRPVLGTGDQAREAKRLAAISSFGAGGANAHLLIEEFADPPPIAPVPREPRVIVLSARTAERLRVYAARLVKGLARLREESGDNIQTLASLAYTLQTGRAELDHRLAFVAEDWPTVLERLERYAAGQDGIEGVHAGEIAKGESLLDVLFDGKSGEDYFQSILRNREYGKIARLWRMGADVPWEALYSGTPPRRVSLPGYPFARDRYWVRLPERAASAAAKPLIDGPALDRSLGAGLSFRKRLAADDAIVADHRFGGSPLLPGAASLEMALEAQTYLGVGPARSVAEVAWVAPLIVEADALDAEVVLTEEAGHVLFEVRTGGGPERVLHAKGRIEAPGTAPAAPARLDLAAVRTRCGGVTEGEALYARFLAAGMQYGPLFAGVQRVWHGDREALALIHGPEAAAGHVLPPALLDGALQSLACLAEPGARPAAPAAVERIEIHRTPPARCYAHAVRDSDGRYRIALADESGEVCVRLHGFALKEVRLPEQDFLFIPRWEKAPAPRTESEAAIPGTGPVWIVHPRLPSGFVQDLAALHGGAEVVDILLDAETARLGGTRWEIGLDDPAGFAALFAETELPETLYFLGGVPAADAAAHPLREAETAQRIVLCLFRLVKALAAAGAMGRPLTLKVVTLDVHPVGGGARHPYGGGLSGLARSLAKEFRAWRVGCLDLASAEVAADGARLARAVVSEPAEILHGDVSIRDGRRYVRVLRPLDLPPAPRRAYREGGVYFILGGAGGIGLALADYLARQYRARLVLIGRRAPDAELSARLRAIEAAGGSALYLRADATDPASLAAAVAEAKRRFGTIHGVFHSALVLRDQPLAAMPESDFAAALRPKALGSVALREAFGSDPLDFIAFLSSLQSFTASANQANYAAGCTFKDGYALALAETLPYPVRLINWGYWGSVGAVADEAHRQTMRALGLHSIEPPEGMATLEKILAQAGVAQVAPIKAEAMALEAMGVRARLRVRPVAGETGADLGAMARRAEAFLSGATESIGAAGDPEAADAFRQIVVAELMAFFQRSGTFPKPSERVDAAGWARRLGILPKYERLFDALLDVAVRGGFLARDGNALMATAQAAELPGLVDSLPARRDALARAHPVVAPHLELLAACVAGFPAVLSGAKGYAEIMFPGGSMHLVEGIYRGNATADRPHKVMAELVLGAVELAVPTRDRPLRIVEIGAGTGGTSAFVLEALAPLGHAVHYAYTDVSSRFTRHGERTFGVRHPFASFRELDIERDPVAQGFEAGAADIVLASNVLHATRDIEGTLWRTKRLLKRNGVLILNEMTRREDFLSLTFGLTDGWWAYDDGDIRIPHSPLLDGAGWLGALSRCGFGQGRLLGDAGASARVIAALSDGLIQIVQDEPPAGAGKAPAIKATAIGTMNPPVAPASSPDDLTALGLGHVKSVFMEVLGLRDSDLDPDATFERYGVDSIVGLELTKRFQKDFEGLSATLLFEHATLRKLAGYFVEQHGSTLRQRSGGAVAGSVPVEPSPLAAAPMAESRHWEPPVPEPARFGTVDDIVDDLSDEEVEEALSLFLGEHS